MLTEVDIKRIKDDSGRVKELENSLSIALDNVDKYQRDNKNLGEKCKEAGRAMIELNVKWESALQENKQLKKRAQEAEGEMTIVKGIGMNSPEMRACQERVKEAGRINKLHQELIEELKEELARAKEDHQYDNLVHQNELKSLRKNNE